MPDKGLRDEHGFEPMDDLFSSPEKVSAATDRDDEYTATEDTMDIVDSKEMTPVHNPSILRVDP